MTKSFYKLLRDYSSGYHVMVRRYPKAAKKRRVLKKWKRKYGVGVEDMLIESDFAHIKLWDHIAKNEWGSTTIQLPFVYEGNEAGGK